jgi:hypothetical protein
MMIVAALLLWFVGGAVAAFVFGPLLKRRAELPPRVSEDELVRHAVEQDAKWRERMMQ